MKFLVLDDMQERHDWFSGALRGRGTVWHAYSVAEAKAMLDERVFDVAFLDHDLDCTDPRGDGLQVAEYIARMPPHERPVGVVVAALFLACVATPPVDAPSPTEPTITVCLNLPLEHVDEAERAVELWDRALRGWRRVVAVSGEFGCDKVVAETTETNAELPEAVGWVDRIGGDRVLLRRGAYERNVVGVVLHELGHALGAQHVPGTLMNESLYDGQPRCPDATTVAQVAAWHRVEIDRVDLEVCE